MSTSNKTPEEKAIDYLASIRAERLERGGRHADDHRIATEIAEHQFQIGRIQKLIVEQEERWKKAMIENQGHLAQLKEIQTNLATELHIATNQDLLE